jgi:hypothetical protein
VDITAKLLNWFRYRELEALSYGPEQACNRNVLVDIGPMDSMSAPDQAPVPTLLVGRLAEAWKPLEWGGKLPAVGKAHDKPFVGDSNVDRRGIEM